MHGDLRVKLNFLQDLKSGFLIGEKRFSQGVSVIISGSCGIPNWISHQKMGAEVVATLPQDRYKTRDLLGFVLYSIYDPLNNNFEAGEKIEETYFKCDLTLLGDEFQLVDDLLIHFEVICNDLVPKMWMIYYPKVAIEKQYHSNKWRQLEASYCGYCCGKALEVKECGIHLIYSHDHDQEFGNPSKVMIPTICRECQKDEVFQLKLCANGDANNELLTTEYSLQSDSLCFRGCKNLRSLPSRISEVKSLRTLFCSGCSQLRSFPEILEDMKKLEQLHLDGTAIEELPSSIKHLQGLLWLNLECCNNLLRLPESICNLKSLKALSCSGCSNLMEFPEIWETLEDLIELDLGGSSIEELPSSIDNLRQLQLLNLTRCKSLRSLPSTICELTSLTTFFCSGCSQLRSFPEILGDMGNLKQLHLDGTAIEELPESIQHLQGLQYLDMSCCSKLVRLPESICYLKSLITLSCSNCLNLRVLPENFCKLSSLKWLYVNFCTQLEKFPENLGSLQCLEILGVSGLNMSMDCFSSIVTDLLQLSKLRMLDLSHCPKLLRVPNLPPTLRVLDVHDCSCLGTSSNLSRLLGFSLLKCFKSVIEV